MAITGRTHDLFTVDLFSVFGPETDDDLDAPIVPSYAPHEIARMCDGRSTCVSGPRWICEGCRPRCSPLDPTLPYDRAGQPGRT